MARFVAMIPSLADAAAFMGTCDIWATSDVSLYHWSHSKDLEIIMEVCCV